VWDECIAIPAKLCTRTAMHSISMLISSVQGWFFFARCLARPSSCGSALGPPTAMLDGASATLPCVIRASKATQHSREQPRQGVE
jgi:hypothetical protein